MPKRSDRDDATAWGWCRECGYPGLDLVSQFDTPAARCGFCGGPLDRTDDDLSRHAARVIAEPLRPREATR